MKNIRTEYYKAEPEYMKRLAKRTKMPSSTKGGKLKMSLGRDIQRMKELHPPTPVTRYKLITL